MKWILVAAFAVVSFATLTACQSEAVEKEPTPLVESVEGAGDAAGDALAGGGGMTSMVPFIQFNGTTYIAWIMGEDGANFDRTLLGPKHDTVRVNASTSNDFSRELQDGDAAFLDAGTPVYSVTGFSPAFMLASETNGQVNVFIADTVKGAAWGRDLLDLEGKVAGIRLLSAIDGESVVGTLSADEVENFVTEVLASPVEEASLDSELSFMVEFELENGIVFQRAYFADAGELSRGIKLSETALALLATASTR